MPSPFATIPSAGTGLEGFHQGFNTAQNFFDAMNKRRLYEAQNAIAMQKLYQQQQLLPHMIQQYEDIHNLQPLKQQLTQAQITGQHALAGVHAASMRKAQQEQNLLNQLLNWKPGQNQNNAKPVAANTMPMEEEEEEAQHPLARPTGEANDLNQNMQNMQQPATSENKETTEPTEPTEDHYFGSVKVLQESTGNPMLDQMAQQGISIGNIKPEITRKTENGIQTTYYPSGKITQQKVGMSDIEKKEAEEKLAEKRMQAGNDAKLATEIKRDTHALTKPYNSLLQAKKLLEKNPNLTGWGPALAVHSGRNKNKDLETLNYIFGNIQTEFAKAFGSKAGAQIAALYGKIKPAIFKQGQANLAMVDAGLKLIDDYIKTNQDDYKEMTGKDLSFHSQKPESGNGKITIVDSNGEEHEILEKNLAEARKIDPNLKVKGK